MLLLNRVELMMCLFNERSNMEPLFICVDLKDRRVMNKSKCVFCADFLHSKEQLQQRGHSFMGTETPPVCYMTSYDLHRITSCMKTFHSHKS